MSKTATDTKSNLSVKLSSTVFSSNQSVSSTNATNTANGFNSSLNNSSTSLSKVSAAATQNKKLNDDHNVNKMSKELAAHKIQSVFRHFSYKKKKALHHIKWMTGSNGHYVLVSLPYTNYTLIPTGQLISQGIAPMAGELGAGVRADGINQNGLSGCQPRYFTTAWSYANSFHSNIKKKEESIIQALNETIEEFRSNTSKDNKENKELWTNSLCRLNSLVLQLRQVNEKIYQAEFLKKIEEIAVYVKNEQCWFVLNESKRIKIALSLAPFAKLDLKENINWQEIKKLLASKGYSQCLWSEMDVQLYGNQYFLMKHNARSYTENELHDYFYRGKLADLIAFRKMFQPELVKKNEDEILRFVNKQVGYLLREIQNFSHVLSPKPKLQFTKAELEKMLQDEPFPVVFATSNSFETSNGMVGEKIYNGSLVLGKDLQVVVTDSKHQSQLRHYLRQHKLRGRVFVASEKDFEGGDCLQKMGKLNAK